MPGFCSNGAPSDAAGRQQLAAGQCRVPQPRCEVGVVGSRAGWLLVLQSRIINIGMGPSRSGVFNFEAWAGPRSARIRRHMRVMRTFRLVTALHCAASYTRGWCNRLAHATPLAGCRVQLVSQQHCRRHPLTLHDPAAGRLPH